MHIQASLAPSAFKSKALPLHVNITHTPPALPDDDKTVPATTADPGAIGSVTLVPSEFSTGSYGWKGSKRVTIEIPNSDGGEPEKVHVMISWVLESMIIFKLFWFTLGSINATVMGSKNVKDSGNDDEKDANKETDKTEDKAETADESAE